MLSNTFPFSCAYLTYFSLLPPIVSGLFLFVSTVLFKSSDEFSKAENIQINLFGRTFLSNQEVH